jgi:hypothetical protein
VALLSSAQRQYETVYTDLAFFAVAPNSRKDVKLGVHVKRVGVEQWLRCGEEATLAVGLEATVTREPSPRDEEQDACVTRLCGAFETYAIVEARRARRDHDPREREFDTGARDSERWFDDAGSGNGHAEVISLSLNEYDSTPLSTSSSSFRTQNSVHSSGRVALAAASMAMPMSP